LRKALLVSSGALILCLAFGWKPRSAGAQEKPGAPAVSSPAAGSLPASLDSYFPPKAKEPVFLLRMVAMATPMSGIIVDLTENDPENAAANYEKFLAQYREVSKLVPEWTAEYPLGPVEGLGQALKTGKQDAVMEAFAQVDGVCMKCHLENMVKVQQKYHWRNFSAIKTKDPVTQEAVGWAREMQYLDSSLNGVSVDLEEEQKEYARKQIQAFKTRFQTLKTLCEECHGADVRKYFVDESVQTMIAGLDTTVSEASPDSQKAAALVQRIGMESCFKCHLVHVPAALAQFPGAGSKNK
jgi:cytochrome c556